MRMIRPRPKSASVLAFAALLVAMSFGLTPVSAQESPGGDVTSIAIGGNVACALLVDHTVDCWDAVELRDAVSSADPSSASVTLASRAKVPGIDSAVGVAAGDSHACALLEDGAIVCWGDNSVGQLGNGTEGDPIAVPAPVADVVDAVKVVAHDWGSCALSVDDRVTCWGQRPLAPGEYEIPGATTVGEMDEVFSRDGAPLTLRLTAEDVWTGGNAEICMKASRAGAGPGRPVCSKGGRLAHVIVDSPVADAAVIGSEETHACVFLTDGSLECWAIGLANIDVPTPTPEIAGITDLADHGTCLVTDQGTVHCGETGDRVLGLTGAEAIFGDDGLSCVLTADGTWCFAAPSAFDAGTVPVRLEGLVAGAALPSLPPTPVPVEAPPAVVVSWDGQACTFGADVPEAPGRTSLAVDPQTTNAADITVALYSLDGVEVAELGDFMFAWTGNEPLPGGVTEIVVGATSGETSFVMPKGPVAAVCFDPRQGYTTSTTTIAAVDQEGYAGELTPAAPASTDQTADEIPDGSLPVGIFAGRIEGAEGDPYEIRLRLGECERDAECGAARYPSFNCESKLTNVGEPDGNTHRFLERFTADSCPSSWMQPSAPSTWMFVSVLDGDQLSVSWLDHEDEGKLTRQ